ncbi:DUF4376 domain-containing protein [Thioclava kandeliae]|uniref:DUF4376 domain-containing protein n=1 Tax=Thioclava kandeliae TaxID=3070818 RepID=A0ABV1SF97_9RHOB
MDFYIETDENGLPVRWATTQEDAPNGAFVSGVMGDVIGKYIKDGVAYNLPERPDHVAVWDNEAEAWVDARTDADRKAEVKARRIVAVAAGTTINGEIVLTDDVSQTRITGAAMSAMLDSSYSLRWKMADGEFVTLDASQIIAFAQAVRAHVQACYDREAELIALIDAGESYDLDAGWPDAVGA